jgi:hypothetical protein
MFDWLVEGWLSVYLILLTAAIILVAVWWRTRDRRWLIGLAVVAGLVGLYALLDRIVETDYEQMVRKTREMAASAQKRDPAKLFEHLADSFSCNGMTKSGLVAAATQRIRDGGVHEVVVWDFARGPIDAEARTGRIIFLVKVKTAFTRDELFFRCEADFTRDADGQWRLQTFRLFDPTRQNAPVDVSF